MRELTLQEIKNIELEILDYFNLYCIENNITYYLSHGTLLGAIRYKGFIPWDDDVDVLVPREDYDKLMKLFKDTEQYKLLSYDRNKQFMFPYAKLCDCTTVKVEGGYNNGIQLGIDIDIFPLDSWNNESYGRKKEVKRLKIYRFCLGLSKLKRPDSTTLIKRIVKAFLMSICKIRGSSYYVEKIIEISKNSNDKNRTFLGNKAWSVYNERDIIKAENFADKIMIDFEGQKFPAPIGYDDYLTSLYGDYLPEPPKEKQKTHHSFTAYKL